MGILVLVEHADGQPSELSLQALAFARAYAPGEPVDAVLVASGAAAAAAGLGSHGVGKAYVVDDSRLDAYAPQAWARSLAALAGQISPAAVIAAGSERGNELLAHVGAITELPFAANCLRAEGGDPATVTRVRWGGSLLEEARLHGRVKLLTMAPHATEPVVVGDAAQASVTPFEPELQEGDLAVRVTERVAASAGGVSLAEAKVVVSGGRGVGSAEGFAVIEELASLLGGAVGCSRAVTIAGWRPHTDQVGQTGTKIAPEIYLPCGISGATQHMAGCKGAKRILAVNSDPDAPIMAGADYAVIGDLHEVLPAVVAEVRKATGA